MRGGKSFALKKKDRKWGTVTLKVQFCKDRGFFLEFLALFVKCLIGQNDNPKVGYSEQLRFSYRMDL